jgi:hypothetical protein
LGKQQLFSPDFVHCSSIFLDDFYRLRAWRNALAGSTIPTRSNERNSPPSGPPAGGCRPRVVRPAHDGTEHAQPSWSDVMNSMTTVRIAVAAAAALFAGSALAQSQSDDQSQQASTPPAAQDVGGSPMSTSASGAPMGLTHAQVYQDLVRSEQSGQQKALNEGLYHGN